MMMFLCFSHNLNYAIGWTVIHSLWQAMLLAFITGIVLIFLRKKTAQLRYNIAKFALTSVFLLATSTFLMYYDFSKQPSAVIFIPTSNTFSTLLSEGNPIENASPMYQENNTPPSIDGLKNYFNHNIYLIVTIWLMGVSFFLLRLLGGISYVYYLKSKLNFPTEEYWQDLLDNLAKKTNFSRKIELLESALVRSPLVVGHLKPMILFPIGAINRLNSNEVEAILAHELAHVMRHDYLFNILQSVMEALFYYHPAVWWLSSQIRNERENCCDDLAIALCGNPITYAKALVSVQEIAYFAPQMAMAFAGTNRKKQLLLRIQRVLNQPKSTINSMEKIISTAVLFLFVAGLAFGGGNFNTFIAGNPNNETTTLSNYTMPETIEKNDENEEKKHYLKYEIDGKMDSLPVGKEINDGKYSFSDNTQAVDLTVKNQRVVQFNINGLEVAGKDIPKFEKLIDKIVSVKNVPTMEEDQPEMAIDEAIFEAENRRTQAEAEADNKKAQAEADAAERRMKMHTELNHGNHSYDNMTINNIGDNKITITKDGVTSTLTMDKNIGRFLLIENEGEEIAASLSSDNQTIMIEGVKSSLTALNKLGWTVNKKGLQPIGGFPEIQAPSPPMIIPPAPPAPAPPHIYRNKSVHVDASSSGFDSEMMIDQLYKDGIVKDRKNYDVKITNNYMKVDGEKVSKSVFEKYRKQFRIQKDTGLSFSANEKE